MRILSFDIGVSNLGFCELDVGLTPGDLVVNSLIKKWEIISLREKCEKIDFDEMMRRLLVELKARWPMELFKNNNNNNNNNAFPNLVLLENQPCMKNPVMKSIQVYIYAYFSMCDNCKPQLFSASNKLKVRRNTLIPPGKKQSQVSYGERKKMAIAVTRIYIEAYDDWKLFFEKQKKKDDFSDCYLQAIYHVEQMQINT